MSNNKLYDKLDTFRNGLNSDVDCVFKDGVIVAEITTKYPAKGGNGMGAVKVFIYDHTVEKFDARWTFGSASGCGYDKKKGAIEGSIICGVKVSHNWTTDLENAGFKVRQVGV